MHDFQFSLWVLDKYFLHSVAILVLGCFTLSFTFTKLATSRLVNDAINKQNPRAISKNRRELYAAMRAELDALRVGRKYSELDRWEKDEFREIRDFYYSQINRRNR